LTAHQGESQVEEIKDFADLTHYFYALYGKQEHQQALDLLTRQTARFPEFAVVATWWRLRMMALTDNITGAVDLLEKALAKGHWYHEDALHNIPDLDALQGMPRFEDLVAQCRNRRLKMIAEAKPSLTVFEPENHPRPWPLLLPLRAADPEFDDHWKSATDAGWLVAIPQSAQVGWFSGLYVWHDINHTTTELQQHLNTLSDQFGYDQNRIVIAGFSSHAQAALKVALGEKVKIRGIIAVEAPLPDIDTWQPIVAANQNPALRCYFVAGKDNAEFYAPAARMVELLRSHGIACRLDGSSNKRHKFPPEFQQILERALRFAVDTKENHNDLA
jgi:predicted esterase